MSETLDHLAEWFDQLLSLPPEQREAALLALPADQPTRDKLRRMLAADAEVDDPLQVAISDAAGLVEGVVDAGQRIGSYRIVRELGSGGMGTVFLAERAEAGFEQRVAIKLMRGFPTEEGRQRLRQERRILAELDHPHIARLLDGGETPGGQPYIVMEYVPGVFITDFFAQRRLDLRARLSLFDEVLDAVAHAHSHLVIHRDLKPGNVLVREDGVPKLLDFGVAKLVDLSQGTTGDTSTRVWTPGYASPEQRAGRGVTTATDVYSLGVLLRELLTGERDHALPPLPDDRRVTPIALDADLRGILAMATSPDAQQRYPTVEALREDLRRYRDGRPVRAARDSGWYRARKFVARHRVGAALSALALAGIVIFGWRLGAERDRALAAETAANSAREQAVADAKLARGAMAFLVAVFSEADPDKARGRQLSPRELVDRGAERVQRELADEPVLSATLRRMFGALYYNMGESHQAVEQLTLGLSGPEPVDREVALDWAMAYDTLAQSEVRQDNYDKARDAAKKAQALRDRVAPGEERTRFLNTQLDGYIDYRQGLIQGSIPKLEVAWKIAEHSKDIEAEDAMDALRVLAHAYARAGDFARADELSKELMKRVEALNDPEGEAMITALRLHADSAHNLGDYNTSLEAYARALKLQRAYLASGSGFVNLLNDYAIVLNDVGRYREALALLDEASRETKALKSGDDEDPEIIGNIASVSESAGDYVRAEELSRRAVEVLHRKRPDDEIAWRRMQSNHARVLMFLGRYDQARRMLNITRDSAAQSAGEESFEYAFETYRLATLERFAGHYAQALDLYAAAEKSFTGVLPEGHPVYGHLHRSLGLIALARGDLSKAEQELTTSREIFLRSLAEDNVDVLINEADRAALLDAQGKADQARAVLAKALPGMRQSLLQSEVNLAKAEVLARKLGGTAPP